MFSTWTTTRSRSSARSDPGGAERHPDVVSVPAAQPALVAHDARAGRPFRGALALEVVQVVGMDDVEQDRPEQTLRILTEELAHRGIAGHHQPVEAGHHDTHRRVEERAEQGRVRGARCGGWHRRSHLRRNAVVCGQTAEREIVTTNGRLQAQMYVHAPHAPPGPPASRCQVSVPPDRRSAPGSGAPPSPTPGCGERDGQVGIPRARGRGATQRFGVAGGEGGGVVGRAHPPRPGRHPVHGRTGDSQPGPVEIVAPQDIGATGRCQQPLACRRRHALGADDRARCAGRAERLRRAVPRGSRTRRARSTRHPDGQRDELMQGEPQGNTAGRGVAEPAAPGRRPRRAG